MRLVEVFQQRDPTFREDQPATNLLRVASFMTDLPTDAALAEAFRLTNMDWGDPRLQIHEADCRSTSIGDVVMVDGEAFQCQRHGWAKLTG